jgi:phosphoglycolate phosphatase
MSTKIVIWDFDGPIVNSREQALAYTQFQFHDVDEHVHRKLFSGNILSELKNLKSKNVTPEAEQAYVRTVFQPSRLALEPIPDIPEVIKELSARYLQVINSSAEKSLIQEYLDKYGLSVYFNQIYGKEIVSKAEKFKLIFNEYSTTPENCLMITDTLGDVLEAHNAAVKSLAVLWGYHTEEYFEQVKDTVTLITEPKQLLSEVASHFEPALTHH